MSTDAVIRWRIGKKLVKVARPEPGFTGKYSPDNATRMKKTKLTIGPAASAFGTSVLMPTPIAVKLSIPTTSTSTNPKMSCGPLTP